MIIATKQPGETIKKFHHHGVYKVNANPSTIEHEDTCVLLFTTTHFARGETSVSEYINVMCSDAVLLFDPNYTKCIEVTVGAESIPKRILLS